MTLEGRYGEDGGVEAAVEADEVMEASERTESVSDLARDDVLSEIIDMVLGKRSLLDLDCENDRGVELYED